MILYLTPLAPVIWLWIFYALYALLVGAYRAHLDKRLNRWNYFLLAPFLVVGVLVDILSNLVLASVIFAERPREWLVTERLQRYMANPQAYKWRYTIANAVCEKLLDPLDETGDHC
jgi:hypothetical protein